MWTGSTVSAGMADKSSGRWRIRHEEEWTNIAYGLLRWVWWLRWGTGERRSDGYTLRLRMLVSQGTCTLMCDKYVACVLFC